MAVPRITDLKMWVGTLFTKDDWDFNFSQITDWLSGGTSDLVVNSLKATNGLDLDGAQISNLGAATSGSQAITLDQANTILNRTSYFYPFSVASGKVDSDGNAAFLQKDSDTQITVLAGNVNPDLVCISSDGTIESVTSNTVLTVPGTDGTYHVVKEKEQSITLTSGSSGKVTVASKFPSSQNIGDYFLDNSVTPFKGYKYTANGWEEIQFCYLGYVTVSSGVATVTTFNYNNNKFDVNIKSLELIAPDWANKATRILSTTYIAQSNGWVVGYSSSSGWNYNLTCTINNVVQYDQFIHGGAGGARNAAFFLPVSKGDSYITTSAEGAGASGAYYFVPVKGV